MNLKMKNITSPKQSNFSIYFLFFLTILNLEIVAQTIPSLPEMSYAKIVDNTEFQGDRWSFMEAGSPNAPAIVMLHGIGGSSVDWRYQLSELSDTYHVIAWNAPGYMLSDGLKAEKPSRKEYTDAFADFLNALKLDKVYLVGNSFGSAVAQCFAYYYPERVIKMVFPGPVAGYNAPPEELEQQWKMRKAQVADGGYSLASKRIDALLAPNPSPELVEIVRKGMRGVHPKEYLRTFNFMTNIVASDEFLPAIVATKVTMPVLLISGAADIIAPTALHGDRLHKALPNSRLEILQGIGHLPHLEAPKQVNSLVKEFFKE
jgi:pimeloyl-ACP methyl ester carboxylesterase